MLAPGAGKPKIGRLWAYLRDQGPYAGSAPRAVLYRYSPDRRTEHPRRHFAGFAGVLHADGYAGFDRISVLQRLAQSKLQNSPSRDVPQR